LIADDNSALLTDILKDVSRSFYLTLRALPRPVRVQIGLAYLLARATDTIADTDLLPVDQRLDALRQLGRRITQGPVARAPAITPFIQQQKSSVERALLLRVEDCLSLLESFDAEDRNDVISVLQTITDGQQQDIEVFCAAAPGEVRALRAFADLDAYTYLVAGCVGEFWTRITRRHLFPETPLDIKGLLALSVRFGKGLQLVNILRDIPSDVRIGRCYLPADQLEACGLKPADMLDKRNFANLRPVYLRLVDIAEDCLRDGWRYTNALPGGQARLRLACAWPLQIGFDTLHLLRSVNPLDPATRPKVSRSRVKTLILKSVLLYPFPRVWKRMLP
jgi:farnesyl-diphosphate farnesyltransferase